MYIRAYGLLLLLWHVSSLGFKPYCTQPVNGKKLYYLSNFYFVKQEYQKLPVTESIFQKSFRSFEDYIVL